MEYLLIMKTVESPSLAVPLRSWLRQSRGGPGTRAHCGGLSSRCQQHQTGLGHHWRRKKVAICCTSGLSASWFPWAPGQKERVAADEAVELWRCVGPALQQAGETQLLRSWGDPCHRCSHSLPGIGTGSEER